MNLDNYKCIPLAVVSRWDRKNKSYAIILITDDFKAAQKCCNAYNLIAQKTNKQLIHYFSIEKCYMK